MTRYLLKRILLMILTMIIIIIIVFFLLRLMPGYPTAIRLKLEQAKTPEEYEAILSSYNPDSNAFVAFATYIKKLFHGNFGTYYQDATKTIPQIFFTPFKFTLLIVGPAFLIGTIFGVVFGFISGYKRGKWPDMLVNVIATFFVAVPSFVLAMFFLLFGKKIGLPLSFNDARAIGKAFLASILPILIISITSFSTLTYYIRNEAVEVLTSDYVAVARAKGLSESAIFFKHVLRNVSLPFITLVFPSFLSIMFGSMIIEMFFDVPGSASIFAMAVQNKEREVVMFSTVFFTAFGLAIQILVDILFVIFDPRIKLGDKGIFSPIKIIKSKYKRLQEKKKDIEVLHD